MDTHSWVLWVGIIAIGLHVMEEYAEGWLVWANQQVGPRFGISFTQADFFFTAFLLIFYALAAAAIGWWAPAVSLAVPALFVVNAVFLHMVPSARSDRLTPGTLSAVFVYLPVAAWMFWAAAEDDVLSFSTLVLAFLLGTALMYYPLAVAILAKKIGWPGEEEAVGPPQPAAEPNDPSATHAAGTSEPATDEPVIEVQEQVIETETIVIETDRDDDDTRILGLDPEEPPRPT